MPIGPFVRRLFGPYERQVADAYRSLFIDLDAWTRRVGEWVPHAKEILEVGCGEGAMTERLAHRYPQARITAIDVTPRLGRLYVGDRTRVEFRQAPVEDIARERPKSFDLIVLSDVIHHVPVDRRGSLLAAVRDCLAHDGVFAFKDWSRSVTPIHWACEAADRWLTGDDVSYLNEGEMRGLVSGIFGEAAVREACHVRPWRNNMALKVCLAA